MKNLLYLTLFIFCSCVQAEKPPKPKVILTDEQLLDTVQYYTFQYFWKGAEPNSGMAPERIHIDGNYPANDAHIITTGGTGMGLIGILGAIERGWITKQDAVARFEKMLTFLEKADRWNGIWPHWLDGRTGRVQPFSPKDDGADLVESAFLMQGLLVVREYFKSGNEAEKSIAARIEKLWKEMDWTFHTQGKDVLYWHWSPRYNWEMNFPLEGYNECLIAYVLAAASPTHSISSQTYHKGWARSGGIQATNAGAFGFSLQLKHNGAEEYGGPLFWAHYSYLSLNPKGLKDQYADYWQENVNQTLINRAWCIENPKKFKGYGENLWGLTASYSINGYDAHRPG
ncbi:MAG: beta-glucosidase, partial [Algoriphagus sp. 32-45-6]